MMKLQELKAFLVKANMPHANGTANIKKEKNGSRTITFEDGKWSMEDNFFGGEPYGGQQVVFYESKPYWICVYYGQVHDTSDDIDYVYDFLREALQYPEEGKPYRGPACYKKGKLEYQNKLEGVADNYSGKEVILENGKQIYWAKYMGGLVDQRAQDSM